MNERRVVITGTGIVSCVGHTVADFWDAVVNGRCGIDRVTKFDASEYKSRIGGEVKNFDITNYIDAKEAKRLDVFCHYAIAAADQAIEQAGLPKNLEDSDVDNNRIGVLVSSGIGGLQTLIGQSRVLDQKGPKKVSPLLIPMMIIDMSAGSISMRYKAKGPNMGIVTACATATHSIGEAYWMIRRNDADIMITGGAEAAIVDIGFAGFCSMKALSERNDAPEHASRPFDAERDGFVMSEGAGVLIIEELEHAKKRGVEIIAEIIGYGATGDAYHITSPSPEGEGAARAMKTAISNAGISPEDVDYINAHGTSTKLNDKFETMAIKSVFGQYARELPISSIKGTIGHGLGAAGGFETICCAKVVRNNIIPPTINYEYPDPECDLNYTPNTAIEKNVNIAMNVNLGFGGHNAVLLVKKYVD